MCIFNVAISEKGPSLIHWLLSMGLVISVLERSKGGAQSLLLVSSWSFIQETALFRITSTAFAAA